MQIVAVEVLVHDQKGDVRDGAEIHEVLELQREEVPVEKLDNDLCGHDTQEYESREEELQDKVSRGKVT